MKALAFFCWLLTTATPLLAADVLPLLWKHEDIGEAKQTPGSASYGDGVFTLSGSMNILNQADGCHIVWQPMHGDGEMVARATFIEDTAHHAKASVCIRESLEPGARHATMAVTPGDGTLFLWREQANAKTSSSNTGKDKGRFPCWLKVVRHGKEFTGYESGDGETWIQVGKIELDFGPEAVAGLCASSHETAKLAKATFDHVALTASAAGTK